MGVFSQLSIVKKMVVVFVAVSVVWCAICGAITASMLGMKDSYSQLLKKQATVVMKGKEIQYQVATQNHALVAYLVATGAGAVTDGNAIRSLQKASEEIARLAMEASSLIEDPAGRDALAQIVKTSKRYKEKADLIVQAIEKEANRQRAEVLMQTEVANLSSLLISLANDIVSKQQALMQEQEATNEAKMMLLIQVIVVVSVGTMILAIVWSYVIAKRMAKPLVRMVGQTEQIASGNLRMDGWMGRTANDEIGKLSDHFYKMAESLRELIQRIAGSTEKMGDSVEQWQQIAEHTAEASQHIAAIMQEVQAAVIQQMQKIGVTSELAAEMAQGAGRIAQNTRQSAQKAEHMMQMSLQGAKEMQAMGRQMETISQSVQHLQAAFARLRSHNENIGNIVEIISNIAKQTNMLALNASIEASRAGIQGRGFSVIAADIRQLSIQTGQSAADIKRFLDQIDDDSQQTVQWVENSMREVEQGTATVEHAENAFAAIQDAIQSFTEDIQSVFAAASQIESMTKEVAAAVEQIHHIAQTTSAQTQEVSAATEEQLASMEEIAHSTKSVKELALALKQATRNFSW